MSLSQITVQFKGILKSLPFQILRFMADLLVYIKGVIGHEFEKVTNDHRFENLKKDRCLPRKNCTWI